jgi:hypothetical protein
VEREWSYLYTLTPFYFLPKFFISIYAHAPESEL